MARITLPPRLILRKRGTTKYWYIRFRAIEYGLHLEEHEKGAAEKALQAFKARGGQWRRRLKGHKTGNNGNGTIYFVRLLAPVDEQPIKIGFTAKDEARFHQVRTSSPWPLELVASVSGHQNTELAIHELCSSARMQGEWFRPTSVVLDAIKAAQNDTILSWLSGQGVNPPENELRAAPGKNLEQIEAGSST
jgi:hypothetical protein